MAEVLGYGAVKYADLSNNRQSNYVFSFDRMLDMKVRSSPSRTRGRDPARARAPSRQRRAASDCRSAASPFDRFQGNTAVYMQYAHARIASIVDKSGADVDELIRTSELSLDSPAERQLALAVLRFPEALESTLDDLMPSRICDYMYELSARYNEFYAECNVLNSEEPLRSSRLILCETTARVLRQCFRLLGITPLMRL